MINQLVEIFSLESRLLNRWQLPLVGLLLMGGLAATASTFKATTPQPKSQAIDSTSIASTFKLPAPQLETPAIDSTSAASTFKTATPQPEAPAIDSTMLKPLLEAAALQPEAPAIDSTSSVAPPLQTTAPQPEAPAIYSTSAVEPPLEAAQPHKPDKALDSTAVALPSAKWNQQAQAERKATVAQLPTQSASIPDGTYLYGQTSEPQQIGKEYIVFEARQGKVIGAMYLPSSEYSCFYGTLDSKNMNLTVVNPYNQTAMSHMIARAQTVQLAAAGGRINLENTYDSLTYPHAVQLEGYQPISQVSASDKQLLNTCLTEYQAKFGN